MIAKRYFDEALEMLPRITDQDQLDEILPVCQAIKDNYDCWEDELVSDDKKAEIAELGEQERIKKL